MRTKIRISGIDGLAEAMMSAGEEMSAKVDEMLEAGGAALEKAWQVKPQGMHHKNQRNGAVAFIVNYGTRKMKATHWVDTANAQGESDAYAEMERVWNG